MSKQYEVIIDITHTERYTVEADSEEEAKQKATAAAVDDGYDEDDLEIYPDVTLVEEEK